MEVKPEYKTVGALFQFQPVFRVPPYQRSYSWEQLELEDFIRDLEKCYDKRKFENPTVHFFGQIVCIEEKLQGTYGLPSFELVDGQQRMSSFILVVLAIKKIYEDICSDITGDASSINELNVITERILALNKRFLYFKIEIEGTFQEINVIELSNRDKEFFVQFIKDLEIKPILSSHQLIKNAFDMIHSRLVKLIETGVLKDRIGNLKMVELILDQDFCLLNMVTSDRKSSHKLFQVLNNRGKNLTEGDLLRSESMRMLETYKINQGIVESAWDDILTGKPAQTEKFLRAIYASHNGIKASANNLFNDFLDYFLPENSHDAITSSQSIEIKDRILLIQSEFHKLRKISEGNWPYEFKLPIEYWDRDRMYLLLHAFDHEECLPLLLSATLLDHKEFSKIVQVLERFVFRYLIICKQYIGDLLDIYIQEAKTIRNDPKSYKVENLITRLHPLQEIANDELFERMLQNLKYEEKGGKSNKPLRYFLLNLEYYYRWHTAGANGTPTCMDKERVYDFKDSTIEHIYPNKAENGTIIADLEPFKNTLGNLTILGNTDNRTGANDDFETKRPIFADSSMKINSENIAKAPVWDKAKIEARTAEIKAMALNIFTI